MNYTRLSKTASLALRHAPEQFGLTLDAEGWVSVNELLDGIRQRAGEFKEVTVEDLHRLMEGSEKKRFEIQGDRIRALYGHSVEGRIEKTAVEPPEFLYHGTSRKAAAAILQQGLLPMGRQYVHLSLDLKTARTVGSRKEKSPVILRVEALRAYRAGIKFYDGNDNTWLADEVPAAYIKEFES